MAPQRTLDLALLVTRLRTAGMRVDVRQYLAAHQMLLEVATRRKNLFDDPAGLASYIGPILCTSVEDQQLFRSEFSAWAGVEPRVPDGERKSTQEQRRPWLATLIVSILGFGTAFAPLAYFLFREGPAASQPALQQPSAQVPARPEIDHNQRISVSAPQVIATGQFDTAVEGSVAAPILFSVAGGLGCAVAVFLVLWLLHERRGALALKRMPVVDDPETITLRPPRPTVIDLPRATLARLATGLRRPRAQTSLSLSLQATIEATARGGGFVLPTFAPHVATPEYLVLIERRGDEDHTWCLMHRWIEQLRERDVDADCLDFETDPRICTDNRTQRRYRLSELLTRYHRAAVLLCAETATLFDEMTGRPKPWLEALKPVRTCVFLTLSPPHRWQHREAALKEMGILVLPATPAGLGSIAELDNEWHGSTTVPTPYARAFPSLIGSDTVRWLDRNAPPDDVLALLLRQLRGYLGPQGFLWLCACALYPQISCSITLVLLADLISSEDAVGKKRALTEHLPALSRLPWLRHCYMPDWLRLLLIAQLPQDIATAMRTRLGNLVIDLFRQMPHESGKGLGLHFTQILRPLDVARAAPPGSPLNDGIFIGFLAGRIVDPLTLPLHGTEVDNRSRKVGFIRRLIGRLRTFTAMRPMTAAAIVAIFLGGVAAVTLLQIIPLRVVSIPATATDQTHLILRGHTSFATAVAPNGNFLIVGNSQPGENAVIWDLAAERVRAPLQNSSNIATYVVSPKSDLIAGVASDGKLSFWDPTGAIRKGADVRLQFASPTTRNDDIATSLSGDGHFLAIGLDAQTWLVDVPNRRVIDQRTWDSDISGLAFGFRESRVTVLLRNPNDSKDYLAEINIEKSSNKVTTQQLMRTVGIPLGGLAVSSGGRYAAYREWRPEVDTRDGITLLDLNEAGASPRWFPAPDHTVGGGVALSPRGEVVVTDTSATSPTILDAHGTEVSGQKTPAPPLTSSQIPIFLVRFISGAGDSRKTAYKVVQSSIEITAPAKSPSPQPGRIPSEKPTVNSGLVLSDGLKTGSRGYVLALGNITVGTQSAVKFFTLSNTSDQNIKLGQTMFKRNFDRNFDASSPFTLDDSCSEHALAPKQSCRVAVTFMPPSANQFEETVNFDVPDHPELRAEVILTGSGVPAGLPADDQPFPISGEGEATADKDEYVIEFGDQRVGTNSKPKQFQLLNNQTRPVSLTRSWRTSEYSLPSNGFRADDTCFGALLAPAKSCTVSVEFAPKIVGRHEDRIAYFEGNTAHARIILRGNAVADPSTQPSSSGSQSESQTAAPAARLKELLAPEENSGQVTVEQDEGQTGPRTVITLPGQVLFALNSALVAENGLRAIRDIGRALQQVPGRITVLSSTDDLQVRSSGSTDNFDLSRARAAAVAELLKLQISDASRIESAGLGSSNPRYQPPSTSENRARNARIEIILDGYH